MVSVPRNLVRRPVSFIRRRLRNRFLRRIRLGWPAWGFDWHNRVVVYNHNTYISRSSTFYNRNAYYRSGAAAGRPGATARPFRSTPAARGYAEPGRQTGTRSGAFSGIDHGGETRGYSSRGSSSFGGGGGGFHRGGGHR